MRKILFIAGVLLSVTLAKAQQANLIRAEEAIQDSLYERAYKLTTAAMEDEKTKKDPLTYYLRAVCLYQLSKETFFIKKNPDAIKEACKMILKGKEKDKDKQMRERFEEFVADLVKVNNGMAEEEYKVNRYSKAIKIYSTSYSMNGDTMAFYMMGKSFQLSADTPSANYHYRTLVNWFNEDNKAGKTTGHAILDPFLFLADYHWIKKNYDSANYFLEVARNIFGDKNSKINFYQYMIAKEQVMGQPPSSLMMEVVRRALKYNPSDTFFIKKENALALYLIRNLVDAGPSMEADSMIMRFAREKAAKGNIPENEKLKEIDIFLQPLTENVLWRMTDYYYVNTHDKAAVYLARLYVIYTASDVVPPTEKEIIDRWIKILDYSQENESPGFVALLMNQALTDYPKSKELLAEKKKLLIK